MALALFLLRLNQLILIRWRMWLTGLIKPSISKELFFYKI